MSTTAPSSGSFLVPLLACSGLMLSLVACGLQGASGAGTEPRRPIPEQSPRHLFVARSDGVVAVHPLDGPEGLPVAPVASLDLGEPLAFLADIPGRTDRIYALGREHLIALSWDGARLGELGRAPAGTGGTHVDVAGDGAFAAVASYGGNRVAILPLGPDGVPGAVSAAVGGRDVVGFRKAHQVRFLSDHRTLLVPCLGEDHIAALRIGSGGSSLELLATAPTPPGAGPRHLDLHPDHPLAYVLNELDSTVTVVELQPAATSGLLRARETVSDRGPGEPASRSSDIHVHPGGRWVFAVHREPRNVVVTFEVASDGGGLRAGSSVPTDGDHARTFAMDRAGSVLHVGNTRSRSITSFGIDAASGELRSLGPPLPVPAPVQCVLMF